MEIDDTLIQTIGLQAVKTFMERQLTLLQVQYLGEKNCSSYSTNWNKPSEEVKEARQEAWQGYKTKYLMNISESLELAGA